MTWPRYKVALQRIEARDEAHMFNAWSRQRCSLLSKMIRTNQDEVVREVAYDVVYES